MDTSHAAAAAKYWEGEYNDLDGLFKEISGDNDKLRQELRYVQGQLEESQRNYRLLVDALKEKL